MLLAPREPSGRGRERGDLVAPADHQLAALVEEQEGRALHAVRDLRASLARRGVDKDKVIFIRDRDGRGVGQREVRYPFVRALVSPEGLARLGVERAHAVRPARIISGVKPKSFDSHAVSPSVRETARTRPRPETYTKRSSASGSDSVSARPSSLTLNFSRLRSFPVRAS